MAAKDLIEGELAFTGMNIDSPNVNRLQAKIDRVKETIRPQGVFSTNSDDILNQEFDVIAQPIKRSRFYFNK